MFRFFSLLIFLKAVLGTRSQPVRKSITPLSHHTAKASGMVSVDLREFGAFVFSFLGRKNTRLQSFFLAWGHKDICPNIGPKKNLDRFLDDFCVFTSATTIDNDGFFRKNIEHFN